MDRNFEQTVEWLLRNGADVNAVNYDKEPLKFLPEIELDKELSQVLKRVSLEECKRQKEEARNSAYYRVTHHVFPQVLLT